MNQTNRLSKAHLRAALAGATALLVVAAACAEDIESLPTIRVTGNYDNGVGTSDAASQGSVNAKLIENRPILRPGELLEFVPGLIVSQHSGDGKANQYYLRGFNLDHGTDFATFVDGMPINMRTHAHGQGYTDLNFLIPELVSRIDYRKGTYYADEGDFASAGAAHLRLAARLDRGIASITGGEHRYVRGLIANSNAVGAGTLLYAVDATYNNGPWDHAEHARPDQRPAALYAGPGGRWLLGHGDGLRRSLDQAATRSRNAPSTTA